MTDINDTSISLNADSTPLARPNNAFSQKIASILSTSYTDPSLRRAIASLDSRLQENTDYARRHLRYNIEAEVIAGNGAALKDYSKLIDRLETIGSTISDLTKSFNEMSTRTVEASKSTKSLLDEASKLSEQQENTKVKKILLEAFKAKFVVSESEIEILTTSSYPIDDAFFKALRHVNKTHTDCQALLATEDQNMGLEIMQMMSQYLDKAYNRLFFSVQRDLKASVGTASSSGIKPKRLTASEDAALRKKLSQSLVILAERPSFFESALRSLGESRQRALSAKFIDSLTVDTRVEKAIDFYAYDPLRYVGDILAYVHSEIVNEREALYTLFEYNSQYHQQNDNGLESENQNVTMLFSPEETIPPLLGKITSAMIKPMKTRIENIIAAEARIPSVYQLIDKLKFYEGMYHKAFYGKSAYQDSETSAVELDSSNTQQEQPEIIKALEQLVEYGWRQFSKCLEENITDIKENMLQKPEDLQPPIFLGDAMSNLKDVLKAYEASMVTIPLNANSNTHNNNDNSSSDNTETTDDTTQEKNQHSIEQVIQDMTEPFLECCNRIASDLPNNDSEIFTINCIDAVKMAIQLYDTITCFKIKHLDSVLDEISEVLVERQHVSFLKSSGILPLIPKVEEYYNLVTEQTSSKDKETDTEKDNSDRVSRIVELKREMEAGPLSKDNLSDISFDLDNFLPSATMESHRFLFKLASPRLAQHITTEASQKFATDFSKLERLVLDIYQSEESKIYFPRTYMDVCVLLAIVDDSTSSKSIR